MESAEGMDAMTWNEHKTEAVGTVCFTIVVLALIAAITTCIIKADAGKHHTAPTSDRTTP